jgi:hypothetical protein
MSGALVQIRKRPRRVGTGSSMDRLIHCASSIALPHAFYETEASERGTVIHDFMANVGPLGVAEALELVPERWREAVELIDISGLDLQLSLAAEVALAYDCETQTARELGRGDDPGIFTDVRDSEIPARMDMVGVKAVPAGRRGLVVSWKTGWYTRRKRVDSDWQLKTEGLCAARAYDLDVVEVQLINIDEGPPFVRKAVYTALELDAIEQEVLDHYARALEVRAMYERNEVPDKYELGDWCTFCPSKRFCHAYVGQVKALAAGDVMKEILQVGSLQPEQMKWAWLALEAVERDVSIFKKMVYGAANAFLMGTGEPPIHLATLPDGRERYLARVLKEGNENVDGNKAFEAIEDARQALAEARDAKNRPLLTKEQLDAINFTMLASDATTVDSTKGLIEEAVKKHVPKGKGKAATDALFEVLRKAGAITRKPVDRVEDITVKPQRAATRKLERGPTDDASVEAAAAEHRAAGDPESDWPTGYDAEAEARALAEAE